MADVGRLAFSVGGALAGNLIAPGIGGSIGFALGTIAGNLIFGGGPGVVSEGPRLNDLKVMSSAPGRPRPILYGTMRLGGNVIWATDIAEHKVTEEVGGKGGPTATNVSYTYTASFAVALCEGPVAALLKVFGDGKLLIDYTSTTGAPIFDQSLQSSVNSGQFQVRFYLGTSSQDPDPLIQSDVSAADTPAFRGTSYIVFENLPLADFGNRIPQITCVVSTVATEAYPTATANASFNISYDSVWQSSRQFFVSFDVGGVGGNLYEFQRYYAPSQTVVGDVTSIQQQYLGNFGAFQLNVAVDALGFIYVMEHGFGGGDASSHITKFDGETFEALAVTPMLGPPFTAGGVTFAGAQIIIIGEPSLSQYILVLGAWASAGSKFAIVSTSATTDTQFNEWNNLTFDGTLPIIAEYDIDALGTFGGLSPIPSAAAQDAAQDGDGYCWILFMLSGLSELALIKIMPSTGIIVSGPYYISGYEHAEPADGTPLKMCYDSSTDSLIIVANVEGWALRWSIDSQSVAADNLALSFAEQDRNHSAMRAGPWNGSLWLNSTDLLKIELDTTTLSIKRTISTASWGFTGGVRSIVYDASTHALVGQEPLSSSALHWMFLDRIDGGGVTLRSIVEDISDRVGFTAGTDLDVSELTDIVHGYVVAQRMEARRAIEPLVAAYFFDGVETDFMVRFPKRGRSSSAALTEDDIGADSGSNTLRPFLHEDRREEVEVMYRLDVTAAYSEIDYQPHGEYAKRVDEAVSSRKLSTLELPIAFNNTDEIAQIAEKLLYLDWVARTEYQFGTPLKHIRLDPTDVVTVSTDGATHTVRVTDTTVGANAIIAFSAVSEDQVVYYSDAEGQTPAGVPAQTVTPPSPITFQVLDTPLMRDDDEGAILYVAAGTYGDSSFPGVVVDKSTDDITYANATLVTSDRNSTIGFATTTLSDAPSGRWTTWDRTNSVTVRLFTGTLSSATELEVLNYSNAALLGDEIIQFKTATLNSDGTYTLSTLLRGRRGTEWATDDHASNERFVLLQAAKTLRLVTPLTDLDAERVYRATPLGGSLVGAIKRTITWEARSLMPYAPCSIELSQSAGSPSDLTVSWLWRTRVGGEWRDYSDAVFSEPAEDYEVDILDASAGSVKRTITTIASSGGSQVSTAATGGGTASYAETDQITDFGVLQSLLYVTVYQKSASVGRGFGRSATIRL